VALLAMIDEGVDEDVLEVPLGKLKTAFVGKDCG
jgi:hypothetical protein